MQEASRAVGEALKLSRWTTVESEQAESGGEIELFPRHGWWQWPQVSWEECQGICPGKLHPACMVRPCACTFPQPLPPISFQPYNTPVSGSEVGWPRRMNVRERAHRKSLTTESPWPQRHYLPHKDTRGVPVISCMPTGDSLTCDTHI